jgi:hypothetical protein
MTLKPRSRPCSLAARPRCRIAAGFEGVIRGGCLLDRAGVEADRAFYKIMEENGGYCFLFEPKKLAERFSEIAAAATLAGTGNKPGAQALLRHLRAVPFDMVVAELTNSKCSKDATDQRSAPLPADPVAKRPPLALC